MKVATVCRDEGAGEECMRGTVATKSIRVCVALPHPRWHVPCLHACMRMPCCIHHDGDPIQALLLR
jgi:hypothetical protein